MDGKTRKITRYRSAGWGERVKMPAAKAVNSPIAYPERACQKYLNPFADCTSEDVMESLPFRWSKQRTNARSIEGIAYKTNMQNHRCSFVVNHISEALLELQQKEWRKKKRSYWRQTLESPRIPAYTREYSPVDKKAKQWLRQNEVYQQHLTWMIR